MRYGKDQLLHEMARQGRLRQATISLAESFGLVSETQAQERRMLHGALVLLDWGQDSFARSGDQEMSRRCRQAVEALGKVHDLRSVRERYWATVLMAHDAMARALRKPAVPPDELAKVVLYARRRLGLDVNRAFVDAEDEG